MLFIDCFIRVYFIRYSDCTIKVYQSLCINFQLNTDSFLLGFVHDECHVCIRSFRDGFHYGQLIYLSTI